MATSSTPSTPDAASEALLYYETVGSLARIGTGSIGLAPYVAWTIFKGVMNWTDSKMEHKR